MRESIEAGLDALRARALPGETFSHRAIAEACGCSWQNIYLIERRALRKVRERLRRELKLSYSNFNLEEAL